VILTVTNDRGRQATASKPITIGAGVLPTASFVYSPTTLTANVAINFDASTSVAGAGHLITGYRWNWGDGTTSPESTSPLTTHTYTAAGTYVIVLTVVDEAGQLGIKTQNMTVAP
jgi:PKD repeat protein